MTCPRCSAQNEVEAQFCFGCGLPLGSTQPQPASPPKKGNLVRILVIVAILAGVGMCGFCGLIIGLNPKRESLKPSSSPQGVTSSSPIPYVSPTPIWSDLTIVKSVWQKDGFGVVATWKVTFKNNSDKPIGNIQYRTTYYSETGAVVDKGGVDSPINKKIIQKVIPPNSTRTIEVNDGFTHSEAHTAKFELVDSQFVTDYR
ncbi:MAG: zinc ribbon domain-containing protein [Acidobacteriota bacterium]